MILSTNQIQAIENGESVDLNISGTDCILVRRDVYLRLDPEYDGGSWTIDEMNLLADEADEIISRQGNAAEVEQFLHQANFALDD